MISITSSPKASLPLSMVSIPPPTSLSNTSQPILTSSSKNKNISLRNQRKLHQFKHSLSISCGVTKINQVDEFSAWKSLRTPHPAFPTLSQHARLTQQVHVGQVSENADKTYTYTVWALPPENVSDDLEEVMRIIRSEHPHAPMIVPHFTVVGPNEQMNDAEARKKFKAACQGVKPYSVTVASVETGPNFYESVYCVLQPSKEVSETAAHCSQKFGDNIPDWISTSQNLSCTE